MCFQLPLCVISLIECLFVLQWCVTHQECLERVKQLTRQTDGVGFSTFGAMLQRAFDLLNAGRRASSGVDHYGQGRAPWWLENAMIVVFMDSTHLTGPTGVEERVAHDF